MAAKSRVARLESEIEKYRMNANWGKVFDAAKQISSKSSSLETYAKFVQVESQLERYLLESPPNEKNVPVAQEKLRQIKREMQEFVDADSKKGLRQEALLLLGKVHYAMGDYSGTLRCYDEVGLDNVGFEGVPNRKLKIIGEAFATKGLCLEKLPLSSTSKFKIAEREEQIIKCFEKSGDVSIHQLQLKLGARGNKTPNSVTLTPTGLWNVVEADTAGVGPIVETAIQRSPILLIRNGNLSNGISRFREMLRAVETRAIQGLRQTLARQLAEVLLRGVCQNTYDQINLDSSPGTPTTTNNNTKPLKFKGENLFVPKDVREETLLLLLISESIATREAILNRSPEHAEARRHTFHNTTAVYDLLTISLVKRAQYHMLTETFERAMKFSFDEFHVWYQYGLSLICAEKYTRALQVLKECMQLQKDNVIVYLQAAKLCYEKLHVIDEGIEFAMQATELENNPMLARSYLTLGLGYSLKSEQSHLHVNRQECQRKALSMFIRAVSHDTNDYFAYFHLALQQALLRQVPDALKNVRYALHLQCDHIHSLHLLGLLLSAQKQDEEALKLVSAALAEHPDNFSLLFTKCKLEEILHGPEEALLTCKQMMRLWKSLFESILEAESQKMPGLMDHIMSADHMSLIHLQLSELSGDRDSGSIRVESLAASKVEQTLSEVASSLGSSVPPKQGPQQTWGLMSQIWLRLGELYLTMDKVESAQACIQEASNIFPVSHTVSCMKGRMLEQSGDLNEAKNCFVNAISINPAHCKSLQHLGMILHHFDNNRQAEKVLRDAVNVDPSSSNSWQCLGKVLEALGDYEAASECLMTAVDLESSSPAVPFSVIPKPLS